MKISNHNSPPPESGTVTTALRITAAVVALLLAPAVLHALVPTGLAILQVVLDMCQFCLSILQTGGM